MRSKSFFWILTSVIVLIISIGYHLKTKTNSIFHGDASGYYAYQPSLLKHGDLSFSEIKKKETNAGIHTNYRIQTESGTINKYTIGVSILTSPFYLIANLFESDDYGPIHHWFMVFASLFYLILGLYFISRFLSLLNLENFTILLIGLGTNLLYYSIAAPLMSHTYSFFLISLLSYLIIQSIREPGNQNLLVISLVFAFLILVRPVNGLFVLFLPFLLEISGSDILRFVKSFGLRRWIMGVVIFIIPISLQMILWFQQTGSLFIWSYPGEGFNWTHPQLFELWFGFRKGLFIYTPVLLFLFVGIFIMWRSQKRASLLFTGGFIILSYILSCWWDWGYGDGFGSRSFIDFYPVMAIPLAFAFKVRKTISVYMKISLLALLILSMMFSYQFYKRILHPNNMSFDKYVYALFKYDNSYINCFGGEKAPLPFGTEPQLVIRKQLEPQSAKDQEFLNTVEVNTQNKPLRVRVICEKFTDQNVDFRETFFVSNGFDSLGNTTDYELTPFYDIHTEARNNWKWFELIVNLPAAHHYRFYVWNRKRIPFQTRNYTIEVFALE